MSILKALAGAKDKILSGLNNFAEETSIHGFAYLTRARVVPTRVIWTVLLLLAFSVATYMIVQNIEDADSHPLITTIDTISVTKVPFPAITIHPGEFRNKDSFFKRLFDYHWLERYNEDDPLRNNTEFLMIWSSLLRGNSWISKFIKETKATIRNDTNFLRKKGMMRNLAAVIAAAQKQDKNIGRKVVKEIEEAIITNMFKYKEFVQIKRNLIDNIFNQILEKAKTRYNISDARISECKKRSCDATREEYEVLLLVPLYIFMDPTRVSDIGAGYFMSEVVKIKFKSKLLDSFATDLGIQAVKNLPNNVVEYANYFSGAQISLVESKSNLATVRELRDGNCDSYLYSTFWRHYIFQNGSIKMTCLQKKSNTSETCGRRNWKIDMDEDILGFHCKGKTKDCIRTIKMESPPCQNIDLAREFGFEECCKFIQEISKYRIKLMKVLKFSIQHPHLLESVKEEMSIFENITKEDPKWRTMNFSEDTRRNFNPFIPLCQYRGMPKLMTFRNCHLFHRSFTNKGLGYSFNSDIFDNVYKDTVTARETKQIMFL